MGKPVADQFVDLLAAAVAEKVVLLLETTPAERPVLRAHKIVRRGKQGYKLTADDVRSIRELHSQGFTQSELASQFNVTQPMIGHIVHRRSWANIP